MPMDFYEDIVRQLSAYKDEIDAVFMINYNEPTADKRFLEQVKIYNFICRKCIFSLPERKSFRQSPTSLLKRVVSKVSRLTK